MAKDIDFYGPFLKSERAEQHIHELELRFAEYVRTNEQALRADPDDHGGKLPDLGVGLSPHTPTILGDAIHNLRAALDHAYCILVEANGGTVNKHTKFPFTENGTRQDLEGSAKGQAKAAGGPSDKMIGVIFDEIQPYPGGRGADLIGLHVLDIADKHMVLLPTEARTSVEALNLQGGGGVFNITLITSGGGKPVAFDPGVRFEKDHDPKVAFEICFGNGQPFEGQPIMPILKSLAARVNETLQLLERRAAEGQSSP